MANATTAETGTERLFYADRGDGTEAPVYCRGCLTFRLAPDARCECGKACECGDARIALDAEACAACLAFKAKYEGAGS